MDPDYGSWWWVLISGSDCGFSLVVFWWTSCEKQTLLQGTDADSKLSLKQLEAAGGGQEEEVKVEHEEEAPQETEKAE